MDALQQFKRRSKEGIEAIFEHALQGMLTAYTPNQNRVITPENVFQAAITKERKLLEDLTAKLFLPGSRVEGLENIGKCLEKIKRGKSVLLLPEHRGNFDVPTFNTLVSLSGEGYQDFLDRLVYIAGRKLNESSELVKMFSEKYARLIISPRREAPQLGDNPTQAEIEAHNLLVQQASRINRAAFRTMLRLKREGKVFVLFPLGGRWKKGAKNVPVREVRSYLSTFDYAMLVSMQGNHLPPKDRMEDERPVQDKIIFRIGKPMDTKVFMEKRRQWFEAEQKAGHLPSDADFEQTTAWDILEMLEQLRLTGNYTW